VIHTANTTKQDIHIPLIERMIKNEYDSQKYCIHVQSRALKLPFVPSTHVYPPHIPTPHYSRHVIPP
jgi:hypothetical protein